MATTQCVVQERKMLGMRCVFRRPRGEPGVNGGCRSWRPEERDDDDSRYLVGCVCTSSL